nr:reverse transcriptase domain-containing protein [Tanacetum cinerariifolium]
MLKSSSLHHSLNDKVSCGQQNRNDDDQEKNPSRVEVIQDKKDKEKDELPKEPNENKPPKKVVIHDGHPDQTVTIRGNPTTECRTGIIEILRKYVDTFAWTPTDMTGIPRLIAEHELKTYAHIEPRVQRKRSIALDRRKVVKEEVAEWLKAGIVRRVRYPSWVANPVLVKKLDNSWRMCIEFKDLNKACPKDLYPLPEIDWKIESLMGFKYKCFLGAYKGYHQIQMAKKDEEKTTLLVKMAKNTIASLKIRQANCVLEAKVYRKWISKSIPEKKEIAFYCILIDKEKNAIKANMDVNNTYHFNPLLKQHMVYRITNFICESTKPYLQTLENRISLRFRKIKTFDALPEKESEFLKHHFEFLAYKAVIKSSLSRRKLKDDISNPNSGNIVMFTMWDELAKHFNKEEIQKISPPIIIAVSSCRVTKYRAMSHLHIPYYINPRTPEAEYAYTKSGARETEEHVYLAYTATTKPHKLLETGTIHPVPSATKNQQKETTLTPARTMEYKTRLPT